MKLIVASKSPRREQLLASLGLELTLCPAVGEEDMSLPLSPPKLVEHLATQKAKEVAGKYPQNIVLGADTVVAQEDQEGQGGYRIFGKPRDEEEAISFLTALSKAPHSVYTGVCITQGEKTVTFHEHTIIQMRPITHEEICAYVAIGESLDKAGAYGIQNLGGLMVSSIQGDYHNVMGLPLSRVVEELAAFGITRTDIFTGAKEG